MMSRRVVVIFLLFIAFCSLTSRAPGFPQPREYVVVIDAGHGGKDPGAVGYRGILEKEVNLAIARLVAIKALFIPNIRVVLTRDRDIYVPLRERIQIANRVHADLYLSIHANAHKMTDARGIETLVAESISGWKRQRSIDLAREIQAELIKKVHVPNRGVKFQRLYLRWAEIPTALAEVGFITNPVEASLLGKLSYQAKIADAILKGIEGFLMER